MPLSALSSGLRQDPIVWVVYESAEQAKNESEEGKGLDDEINRDFLTR
jgi:hypothetical protein